MVAMYFCVIRIIVKYIYYLSKNIYQELTKSYGINKKNMMKSNYCNVKKRTIEAASYEQYNRNKPGQVKQTRVIFVFCKTTVCY